MQSCACLQAPSDEDSKPDFSQLGKSQTPASAVQKAGIGKNPHAPTNFLPDRQREAAEANLRQQLRIEYQLRQQVRCVLCFICVRAAVDGTHSYTQSQFCCMWMHASALRSVTELVIQWSLIKTDRACL